MSDDLDVLLRETLRHHLGRSGDEPGDLNEVVRRSRRLLARRRTRLLGAALVAVCALSAVVVTRPFHSATVHPDTSLSGDAADCPRGSNPARLPLPSEGKVRLGAVMASL